MISREKFASVFFLSICLVAAERLSLNAHADTRFVWEEARDGT